MLSAFPFPFVAGPRGDGNNDEGAWAPEAYREPGGRADGEGGPKERGRLCRRDSRVFGELDPERRSRSEGDSIA